MSLLADRTAALESRGLRAPSRLADAVALRLTPSAGGWALRAADGRLVVNASGSNGRRRCLEFARAHGALVVFS
jgi:hypothetical protein